MGVVYEALQPELHRRVAIKVLPHQLAQDKTFVKRFYIEAEAAASVHHPNIATIYEIGEQEGTHYFAMEYIEGTTLEELLREEGVTLKRAIKIVLKVAAGIHYAHEHGVIHRDIKPSNIMIDREKRILITDFGLAKTEESTVLTVDGTVMGTPSYMSPEQVEADPDKPAGKKMDVYSMGVILYQMVTGGILPFKADSNMAVMKKLSRKIRFPRAESIKKYRETSKQSS